ncbi:MAG: sensor histidine kinase [Micromonosporaceae bacterium]|nr:sensor histidine kinase [Micromonosporaceae bacterium]
MLLDRLRIRGKLGLLAAVPLTAVVGLAVSTVLDGADQIIRITETSRTVNVAGRVGSLVQDLQQERLLSVGLLLGTASQAELSLQVAACADRITDLREDLGEDLPSQVRRAVDGVKGLADLRQAVGAGTASPEQVMTGYEQVISSMLGSLRLTDNLDTATTVGHHIMALEALMTADEATTAEATALVILADRPSDSALAMVHANHAIAQRALGRIETTATSSQRGLRRLIDEAFEVRFGARVALDPYGAIAGHTAVTLYPAIASFITLGNFVEKRITADVTAAFADHRSTELVKIHTVSSVAILVVLVVLVLAYLITRAVIQPLIRLTTSAERVAQVAEAELVRVADDESDSADPVHLDSLDIDSRDEIGDLAQAFERVQSTASRLVERQVASRRNIAEMFGHIGRRTHNLVSRQVSLIDTLESEEADPDRLRHLYRLDHLSNRLLRNASSLVVLSGAERVDHHVVPVSLADVVRLALGEIEGYERVDVQVAGEVSLTPAVVTDLILVSAELMENATVFSPPSTRVAVTAERTRSGARLTIVDHGIGMSAERMAEENARMMRRERLDLVPTQVLGLFVVGRLSRMHGMRVELTPTPGGGVTAIVDLGEHLLTTSTAAAEAGSVEGCAKQPEAGSGLSVLRRADDLITSAESWNAFAITPRPAQETPRDAEQVQHAVVSATANDSDALTAPIVSVASPAAPAPPRQQPANPAPVRVSPSGLRRRVPGACSPISPSTTLDSAEPPVEADAVAVRGLVEEFELGVARAINDVGADQ